PPAAPPLRLRRRPTSSCSSPPCCSRRRSTSCDTSSTAGRTGYASRCAESATWWRLGDDRLLAADRIRPPPLQRGHAQPPVRKAGCAPDGERRVLRRLGAERRPGERDRRLQQLGPRRQPASAARVFGHLGRLRRRRPPWLDVQVPPPLEGHALVRGQGGSICVVRRTTSSSGVGGLGPLL